MATFVDLATLHVPSPLSKPPATWGSQIRENETFLHDNRREICTSGTRPTAAEGREIYETDTNLIYVHDGSNWVRHGGLAAYESYTPTISGAGTALGNGSVAGGHRRTGTRGNFWIVWTLGSTSTVGAGGVSFSLPSGWTGKTSTNLVQDVSALYNDTSAATTNAGVAQVSSGGTTVLCVAFQYNGAAAGLAYTARVGLAAAIPFTWANTDYISLSGGIEIAP